ncbi:T9SS type A sorting domain-containing protein [Ulvibacter antarcticus]|uniref:Putative delta-60 repeat protein/predicted secreted protein (Por secretion system target) n=1 Tax=Ulvibacter antarcticus TaxID=442714 RepID=A0A3L9Z0N8_9FLAO|nr:T9SS type A sorting domain-containing protein [Ulvibacter antarcticus]RMA66074.1 putative delta-60 repeat protein/predicted secreted protein (Por secretion system target) [Ulvibacter antarcticus]
MKPNLYFLFVLCLSLFNPVFSQDGSPDLTFGDNGIVTIDIAGDSEHIMAATEDGNNRIVMAGFTDGVQGYDNLLMVCLEDGSLDTSFGDGGVIIGDIVNGSFYKQVKAQSDNKILLSNGYGVDYAVSRLLADGTLDIDFATNGILFPIIAEGHVNSFSLTNNGEIVLLGYNNSVSNRYLVLKRYLSEGSVDVTFGANGTMTIPFSSVENLEVRSIDLLENGNSIISYNTTLNNIESNYIARVLANGTIDTSFGTNGHALIPIEEEYSCAALSFNDGSVLASCIYWDQILERDFKKMLKLQSNGSLDTSFGNSGYIENYYGALIQENQRIISDNSSSDWEGGLYLLYMRLYSTGNSDTTFQFSTNYYVLGSAHPIVLNSGKLLVAGSDIWYNGETDIVLQRFHNDPLEVSENIVKEFQVYPNPSNGIFTLKTISGFSSEIPFMVNDVSGKIIQKSTITYSNTEIDLSEAANGMYFLKAGNTVLRLIKN